MSDPRASVAAPRLGERLVAWILAVAAAGALLVWAFIALVHVDDRERVGHVQGAWMALARYANEGVLYPPLFDGEHYGGTRWMPLGIVLHAAGARLVGSELVGGKAIALLTALALLGLALVALRRLRSPWPLAGALLAAVWASEASLFTTATIGVDVLAAAVQVAALVVFLSWAEDAAASLGGSGGRRTRALIAAGVLAGLGPLAKLTAGWAALAILCRLGATRRWRDLGVFLAAASVTTLAGVGAGLVASGGRLWDSVGRLAFAGGAGPVSIVRAPNQVVYNLVEYAPGILALLPFVVAAIALARRWRELSVVDWALAWALVALLAVFTDVGTGLNQLVDVLVLSAFVAAQLPDRMAARVGEPGLRLARHGLGAAALTAVAAGVVMTLVPAARDAAEVARHGHPLPTEPLTDVIGPGDVVLSEDPYVPVTLERRPVVLDPFMLRRIDEVDPAIVDPLIERIEQHGFDHVVLLEDLDESGWWEGYHFGPRVADALRQGYELSGTKDGYLLYRPAR